MRNERPLQQVERINVLVPAHLNYLISFPKHYDRNPSQRWPLVLYLHGLGQRGDDIQVLQEQHGLLPWMRREDAPFVIVTPQCPARSFWLCHFGAIMALLDHVVEAYAIDEQRISITGISMGALVAWHLPIEYPERFAASVPVAGWCPRDERARIERMKTVPVWAFHGAKDQVMALAEAEESVQLLERAGGTARLTVYPEGEHAIWNEVYGDEQLYRWLLSQRRESA